MRLCLLKIDAYYLKSAIFSESLTSISDRNFIGGRLELNCAQDHFPCSVYYSLFADQSAIRRHEFLDNNRNGKTNSGQKKPSTSTANDL